MLGALEYSSKMGFVIWRISELTHQSGDTLGAGMVEKGGGCMKGFAATAEEVHCLMLHSWRGAAMWLLCVPIDAWVGGSNTEGGRVDVRYVQDVKGRRQHAWWR